ncbi:MAG: hypothetical protein AB7K24_26605 [Gemmataceae bacterium]
MRRFTYVALFLGIALVHGAEPVRTRIQVDKDAWGNASPADIRAVCRSSSFEIEKHLGGLKLDPIVVRHSNEGPICLFRRGPEGERIILLDSKDTYWSQFGYQFAHEFCHHLCACRGGKNPNLWFEESLCELASLFALRGMAETWKTQPPYSNWKGYAPNLAKYAQERIDKSALPEGMTLAAWFRQHEAELRKNGTDREKNNVVARALLPLFEKNPAGWQALATLNGGERDVAFRVHLKAWHDRAPKEQRPFIAELARAFELKVD